MVGTVGKGWAGAVVVVAGIDEVLVTVEGGGLAAVVGGGGEVIVVVAESVVVVVVMVIAVEDVTIAVVADNCVDVVFGSVLGATCWPNAGGVWSAVSETMSPHMAATRRAVPLTVPPI